MADRKAALAKLLKVPGNEVCADCGLENPEWASYNIGVFLCASCAGVHRSLGSHISKVRSLTLDNWDDEQIKKMEEVGNLRAKEKYEQMVPPSYRRPNTKDVQVLREQWIRGKYERMEFTNPEKQTYLSGYKEGYLWKQGKDDSKFMKRRFVLSENDNKLVYFNKENAKEPKASLRLDEINAIFVPDKIGNLNGLQVTYDKEGTTRSLFLYAEEGKDIVDWYNALRAAKLNRLRIAFPLSHIDELSQQLTRDFVKEGWLFKQGPNAKDAFRKRWFTLDKRRLMYSENPLDAFPKGEVFIGNKEQGFAVRDGVPPGRPDQTFGFTLKTPDRPFILNAESQQEKEEWMSVLKQVVETPLTPQDSSGRRT
ncbi:arf-GAP with dual PH domain-containing protein 1 isoform X2 [Lingula anatina]|uniref:Arf-GAP with dual PH domain-containing protein 1 isoform X2 n=1 Tax=Lingula anatina TaxID=7574 RepID=A0A1S3HNB0_LINAN|nr:arf-GAP with dual PH domain-containing protein 1 isoform X2 [Lingula anatina]|eukprot:XP_013387548.1 arf-GAP with dual PH domain-containing protein 1 isoform X2 [Lingula anatina]